jgi:LysM repeat protein
MTPSPTEEQNVTPPIVAVLGCAGFIAGLVLVVAIFLLWTNNRAAAPTPTLIAAAPTVDFSPSATPDATVVPSTSEPTRASSAAPTEEISPSPTAAPTVVVRDYVVQEGDTLFGLAQAWGVTIDDIMAANAIPDPSLIHPGDVLIIPAAEGATAPPAEAPAESTPPPADASPEASPLPTAAGDPSLPLQPAWPPSHINDDLPGNYPLSQASPAGSLMVHYQPGTYPAENIDWLLPRLDAIWADLLNRLGGRVGSQVDVYLAGTLFALNPGLQGYTQSGLYRSFVLVNGVFDQGEAEYILAHELTHIVSTYAFGAPYAPMIHEGLALYLPQSYLTDGSDYLSHEIICAAALQTSAFRSASQLDQMSYGATGFGGHIRTFLHYNLSGCFAGFLIERYGLYRLNQVYSTGNYEAVYGKTLEELDQDWQVYLATIPVYGDPVAFIGLINEIGLAYDGYLAASAGGYHANWEAYVHITRARRAANQGQLDLAGSELAEYYRLMADSP